MAKLSTAPSWMVIRLFYDGISAVEFNYSKVEQDGAIWSFQLQELHNVEYGGKIIING